MASMKFASEYEQMRISNQYESVLTLSSARQMRVMFGFLACCQAP